MTATVRTRKIILLPKFNTWEQVLSERKKGSLLPVGNTVSRFFFKKEKRNAVFYILIFTTHHFLYTINLIFRKKMRKFAI